ncbi:MAG TPA: T9SS type A sorting domain-containing protein [Bacteroidia bacterium]|nr:T9SS type A sorting domain-containing protein [Bacteroidia bacterium]
MLIFSSERIDAQTGIGFGAPGLIGMPDTVYSGYSTFIGAYLKNFDTSFVYSDSIRIDGYVDTLSGPHIPFSLPASYLNGVNPGDSLFFPFWLTFKDTYMGGNLRIGGNVIVVWPATFQSGFSTADSVTANIFLIDTLAGTGPEHLVPDDVKCFPVPASGPLYISCVNPNLRPKSISVHDAGGRVIYVNDKPSSPIDTDSWAPGVYFLEIEFDNGGLRVYKIMKN